MFTPIPPYPFQLEPKLILDSLKVTDAEDFFSFITTNRTYLSQFDPWIAKFKDLDTTRQNLAKIQNFFEKNQSLTCGIWANNTLIGYIICGLDLDAKTASPGYGIDQRYEGRGIITRAARVVLDYAFNNLGIQSAELTCWTNNSASIRVAQRLGFKRDPSIIRADPGQDLPHDQYRYTLKYP